MLDEMPFLLFGRLAYASPFPGDGRRAGRAGRATPVVATHFNRRRDARAGLKAANVNRYGTGPLAALDGAS